MSKIKLTPNASGTGVFTIASPNSNTDYTINLPEISGGEFVATDASGNVGIGTGTPTPAGLLHLKFSGTTDGLYFQNTTGGTVEYASFTANTITGEVRIGATNASAGAYFPTFYSNGLERMRIDASGNVSIGASSPAYNVDVNNADSNGTRIRVYNDARSGVANATIGAYADDSNGSRVAFGNNAFPTSQYNHNVSRPDSSRSAWAWSSYVLNSTYENQSAMTLQYVNASGTQSERLRVNHDGDLLIGPSVAGQVSLKLNTVGSSYAEIEAFNFGIGWDKPIVMQRQAGEVWIGGTTDRGLYNLQVNNTGVWGQGSYVNGSDARWKDNVQTLDCNCLDIVNSLRSVSYTYNEDSGASDLITPHLGFIAQEVEQAAGNHPWLSGLVTEDPQGYKSMAYQELIPVLTKAIQEQQAMIEDLESRLSAVEAN